MIKKGLVLLVFMSLAFIVFTQGENMVGWLRQGGSQSYILTTTFATLLALFPIIPYPIIGGVIGAVFGPIIGSLLTWIGSSLASIIMFTFIRYAYQDWGERLLHRYQMTAKVTALFEKNAFMTIFITRLIPIVPSILVNAYAALSRVSGPVYIIASSLGKIPAMILFATVGNTIVQNPAGLFIVALFYGVFLLIVYGSFTAWKRFLSHGEKA
ncbi:TVP38/TMEM64 family protein [Shouchella lonarensis]|uniref:TVP38/TMEM64 family membrane protein n=1 Tax=Shouchella lonarensis TaxID=1464122 RepID=A0A1G6IY43_9BACI|nr:TVP38/TMEM64 family protein [Shouchella lonarensis]SDC11438.1 Uncharacterized membrane protein YdjX, TVP38/TMEM64 family, SNARE-associated domain [Shouchella lonarensis]